MRDQRRWAIVASVCVGVASVGFFSGTRVRPVSEEPAATPVGSTPRMPEVPRYASLGDSPRGPNATIYAGAFEKLAPPTTLPPDRAPDATERLATLEVRNSRRAFDGAPPQIPHAIDQQRFPDCLTCHQKGGVLGGRFAPPMSHARMDNCVQCHVVATAPAPLQLDAAPENSFEGLRSVSGGARAWPGAPPQIPHTTQLRDNCGSCHGSLGSPGIRTTHPERQNCTQCHAPSATRDQRQRAESPPPWEKTP